MHKNPALILRILSSSVCISEKAGSIIREIIRKGNLNTIDKVCIVNVLMTFFLKKFFFAFSKGFNDLQTEADRSSEKCIVKSLEKKFPKLTVIGEEVCVSRLKLNFKNFFCPNRILE